MSRSRNLIATAATLLLSAAGGALADEPKATGGGEPFGVPGMVVAPQDPATAGSVFVAAHPGTRFTRGGNNIIELESGAIVVSVRPPAEMATVVTSLGNVSIAAQADALVAVRNGAIKVQALKGNQESVVAMLDKAQFSHMGRTVLPVAPGRELMAYAKTATAPPAPQAPAADGTGGGAQQAAPAAVLQPQPGSYVLGESTAASLTATAFMVSAMDNAITNAQQRKYLRDVAEATSLGPYWKNVRIPEKTINGLLNSANTATPAAVTAPATSPAPTTDGALPKVDGVDEKDALGSVLGDEKAADAAASGAAAGKESDLLGGMFAEGPEAKSASGSENGLSDDEKSAAEAVAAPDLGKALDQVKDVLDQGEPGAGTGLE